MSSPTQRSLKLMRERGYTCAIVEHWNPFAHIRQDLYGVIDILCIKEGETVAVQACNYSDVSKRVQKIADSPNTAIIRSANWKILIHGWHKVKNRYQVREVDVS